MRAAIEREPVIALAKSLMASGNYESPDEVAVIALCKHFHLVAGDGIWGDSYAAECMGFRGHSDSVNLLEKIAGDVAREVSHSLGLVRTARH